MNTIRVVGETIHEVHFDRSIKQLVKFGVNPDGLEEVDPSVTIVPGMIRVGGVWQRPAPSPQMRAAKIKAECSRRIYAVMSDVAQRNINAYITDLSIAISERDLTQEEQGDVAVARSARGWVTAMQQAARMAAANGMDPAWPEVPNGVAELVERF